MKRLLAILFLFASLACKGQCYIDGWPIGVGASTDMHPSFHYPDTICAGRCFKAWATTRHCDYNANVTFSWIFEGSVGADSIRGDTVTVCYEDTGSFRKWMFASHSFTTDSSWGWAYITVVPCPPVAAIEADRQAVCTGECVRFSDPLLHVADTWEWHFPGGVPEHFTGREPPPVCYNDTGRFDATLTVTSRWGSTSEHKAGFIHVAQAPVPRVVDSVFRISEGETALLPAPALGEHYRWEPLAEVLQNDDTALHVMPGESRVYTCTVSNANGCAVGKTYEVRVQSGLLVPKAFSPNRDGRNDVFRILNENITVTSFSIWNRWGELVFRSGTGLGWDGTYKGGEADMGVYVWQAEYTVAATGARRTATGSVALVR